jgi:AcrR family transcriptional regulator
MSDKKQKILHAALKLFATKGFASTSTQKVALEAGVSEGLIFRHFQNKEGLLNAILSMAKEAALAELEVIVNNSNPREKIRQMIELPYKINPENYEMWRLTYALKWQVDGYDETFYALIKTNIEQAFEDLGYADPVSEAQLLFILLDGTATLFLLQTPGDRASLLGCLLKKYNL